MGEHQGLMLSRRQVQNVMDTNASVYMMFLSDKIIGAETDQRLPRGFPGRESTSKLHREVFWIEKASLYLHGARGYTSDCQSSCNCTPKILNLAFIKFTLTSLTSEKIHIQYCNIF